MNNIVGVPGLACLILLDLAVPFVVTCHSHLCSKMNFHLIQMRHEFMCTWPSVVGAITVSLAGGR